MMTFTVGSSKQPKANGDILIKMVDKQMEE